MPTTTKRYNHTCLTEGCGRPSSNNKYCCKCRMPRRWAICRDCKVFALHYASSMNCRACVIWKEMNRSQDARRKPHAVTITKVEYDKLLADATVCEDSGHVFAAGELDSNLQKSVDRLDNVNSKGYEPGNIRVVTTRTNLLRGEIPIDTWRLAAAHMTEHNTWPSYNHA